MAHEGVESVERALKILDAFSDGARELTLADLTHRTGLVKSTVLRLCRSLERYGYLTRTAAPSYRLGPTLWRLGSLYRATYDLAAHVRPVLVSLSNWFNESASFFVEDRGVRVCLLREHPAREIRHNIEEGARLPLEAGAAGHVLRAYSQQDEKLLQRLRMRGYIVSMGERDPDIAAVAVPVVTREGAAVGALCLSGLITHFDEAFQAACAEALIAAAGRLSLKIG
ncbi:MAG: IclR family transcriptional regulator [Magnetospiraceae bacterium]